jgi:hypothetical protein
MTTINNLNLQEKTIKIVETYVGTYIVKTFMERHNISYNRVQKNSRVVFSCRHKSFTNGVLKIVI